MENEARTLPEILAHIFSFLDARAKVNASSVCKRWMKVFNDYPDLLLDVYVDFNESSQKTFSTMTRNFPCFIIGSVDINEEFFLFLERFGPQFRSLAFSKCAVFEEMDMLGRKLQNCKQLLELKVFSGGLLQIFPHLPALKKLEFNFFDDLHERDLEYLRQIIPLSLTHFSVGNYMLRDYELLESKLENFIYKRRFSLQSLEFSGLDWDRGFLDCDRLWKMEGLRLKRLKVDGQLLNTLESSFCNHQPGIVVLEIEDYCGLLSSAFNDANVVAICTALPRLEELSLVRCTKVNESVAAIFQLKRLRRLELIRCHGITAKSFLKALEGLTCSNLEILNLRDTYIGRSTLSKLLTLVPNLREIHL